MYKHILKPLLFLFEAERAHHIAMTLLKWINYIPAGSFIIRSIYGYENPTLQKKIMGLTFHNPVGLAAGFDKDGVYFGNMHTLGFGFIEVGTVTPVPQSGNEKPRLFRLKKDQGLINRMGFNNLGVEHLVKQLQSVDRKSLIIGGNIGKNKITDNELAASDYLQCFHALHDHVDYFVVNVSSPNTPGLRALQDKEPLMALLQSLVDENLKKSIQRPILLKIAPDLTLEQLDDVAAIVSHTSIDGIIATNTTLDRSTLTSSTMELDAIGNGGLSGLPLRDKATTIIKYMRSKLGADKVIIGVGGIHSASDAKEKIKAGADLIQIYTGFIYEGPSLIKEIKKAIVKNK